MEIAVDLSGGEAKEISFRETDDTIPFSFDLNESFEIEMENE